MPVLYPENMRCFQGVKKWTSDMKWVKIGRTGNEKKCKVV